MFNRRVFVTLAAALGIAAPAALLAQAPAAPSAADKEKAALAAGVEAVVYGYPLVIMDVTKDKTTNFASPVGFGAPLNEFANVPTFPDSSFKDVVRANVDTLYSSAFLDLSAEPLVMSVPDTNGRYYLMPMLDAWTNVFASPGKRTTGTGASGEMRSTLPRTKRSTCIKGVPAGALSLQGHCTEPSFSSLS